MFGGGITISSATFFRLSILLLYVPVCLAVFRWLFPRLTRFSKLLALVMLAAQALLIVISLELRPLLGIERWLWNIDLEWNIPSALASAQLMLVAAVALLTALLARTAPAWQRAYLLAAGLVFALLGLEEFYSWKSSLLDWRDRYALLGAATAAATLLVAVFSSWRTRIWLICLLAGLALIGLGGLVFDNLPALCLDIGLVRTEGCVGLTKIPDEILEFMGGWLALIGLLGQFSDAAPRPQRRVKIALLAFTALWFSWHSLFSLIPTIDAWLTLPPASVQIEGDVALIGYRSERDDSILRVELLTAALRRDYERLGYSVYLVDQATGQSIAGRDADAQHAAGIWPVHQNETQVFRQTLAITLPPQLPVNRAYWLLLKFWRREGDDFITQQVLASDHPLLDDRQIVLDELVLTAPASAATSAPLARFENGFALQSAELPASAKAGADLTISFTWRSESAGAEDHAQFLHLGHEQSGEWWVYDQAPLGDRLPTRLWYSGLADSETWQAPLPPDLAPGQYRVFTGLYRARDQERVPAEGRQGLAFVDGRVPLGRLLLE